MAGVEQNVDMNIDPDEIDFFLWVSHGSNASDDSEYFYFPFEYEFNYLVMYSNPLKPTSDAELDAIIANPCDMVTGTCPILPIQKMNGKKKIYLPPLLFNLNRVEVPSVREKIGLWRYQIQKLDHDDCKIVYMEQVHNYDYLLENYQYNNITYASIFDHVNKYCDKFRIPRDTVLLGIFSCQSSNSTYINKPATRDKISGFVPRIKERNIQIEFETAVNPNNNYLPLMIPYNYVLKRWEPLGGITRQGCGLNVLAYYDLMPENEAIQETTCLYKGTSIFKIVQYIADGLLKKNISINSVLVIRYKLFFDGITIINYMLSMPEYTNYAIIFKIYKSSDNHAGHTISILKMKDSEYYLIDPQLMLSLPFKYVFNLNDIMKTKYSDKHYIDIIYCNTKNSGQTNFNILEMHSKFSIDTNYNIVTNYENLSYGGKKNKKSRVKGKSRGKGKKQVKGRGLTGGSYSNKTIKRTKKEEKKEEREKIKNIQKILKQTDSKNNIKTALIVDSTVIYKDDDMIFSNETPNL
jgi:hypothetical protein